jgi:uncharacterized protein with FMN-binding domain
MKRIVLFVMTTLTILVLLFGYHTSTSSRAVAGDSSVVAPVATGASSGSSSTTAAPSTAGITVPSTADDNDDSAGSTASSTAAPSTTSPSTATPSTTSAAAASGTVLGDSADTRWGPVQVQITVQNGKITAVTVPVYPNNNGRDQEINATALPILVQETLTAQNASIDMVSGATVTSDGYLTSLQSALDKAGL